MTGGNDGTPVAVVEALASFAEAECGHDPYSARHPLDTVTRFVRETLGDCGRMERRVRELEAENAELRALAAGLAGRVADQSELLSKLAERGPAPTWSKAAPAAPGWYWFRGAGQARPAVAFVLENGIVYAPHDGDAHLMPACDIGGEWCGPLEAPA